MNVREQLARQCRNQIASTLRSIRQSGERLEDVVVFVIDPRDEIGEAIAREYSAMVLANTGHDPSGRIAAASSGMWRPFLFPTTIDGAESLLERRCPDSSAAMRANRPKNSVLVVSVAEGGALVLHLPEEWFVLPPTMH